MQKGLYVNVGKMNIYLVKTVICTSFGAFCCKMKGVLVLNAVRFDAKCRVFWY